MEERKPVCMLCEHGGLRFVHKLRNDISRNAVICDKCGHVQVSPLPTIEEDWDYNNDTSGIYKSIFIDDQNWQSINFLAERYRAYVENQPRKFEQQINRGQRILEIGAGYGWLVQIMRQKGYAMDGVEISQEKREVFKKRTGDELYSWNFLEDTPEVNNRANSYDVICMMQTLEHISDPKTFVNRASKLLKPYGVIYIDVPNMNDFLKTLSKEYMDFCFTRDHLSYFTPQTLEMLLLGCGFENVKVYGHQIFSVENAIHWIRNKEPFKPYHQIDLPEPLQWINQIYKEKIESDLASNSIIAVGTKGETGE